ncbi:MAG: DUF4278 domain-containing protein [Cyanobacteria bacterium]|nr:DUF4278 domain-containing protein [Cyanobacteriota bacterium]
MELLHYRGVPYRPRTAEVNLQETQVEVVYRGQSYCLRRATSVPLRSPHQQAVRQSVLLRWVMGS